MECQFVTTNGHSFRCTVCGRVLRQKTRQDPGKLHFRCGVKPQEKPAAKRRPRDPCRERRADWPPDVHVTCRKQTAKLADSDLVSTRELVCGPGCHAKRLLESLKINPILGCDCEAFARKMDDWGVAGCRGEHYDEIVTRFREYAKKYDWRTKLRAAMLAIKTGLACKLDPLDPAPGIVDEAIRRAEAVGRGLNRVFRIGLITPTLTMGGAERWLLSLARHIANPLAFAGIASPGPCAPPLARDAEEIGQLWQGPSAIRRLSKVSDCLVVWGLRDLNDVPEWFRGRVVLVSHGQGEWTSRILDGCLPRATHLTAVSRWAAQAYKDPTRVKVIHNGISTQRCQTVRGREATRASWGLRDSEIAVGFVGRFSPEKNPTAAASAVRALGKPYRAVYVGEGWRLQETLKEVRGLCPDAIYAGPVDNMGDVYAALDCNMLASPSEGMSLGLCEAWYCGCPTVSTPVGAVPELEEQHGAVTVQVPVGASPEQLGAAVCRAMSPANSPVVERARCMVRDHYTEEHMGARWRDYLATEVLV